MDNNKQKDILEIYADLPDDLQRALFAPETANAIRAVGKKYELTLDKVGVLAGETGNVMMGITPTSEFIKNISEKVGVDKEKARMIAEDINQQIFAPVRESLKKVHRLEEPKNLSNKPAQSASKETTPHASPLNPSSKFPLTKMEYERVRSVGSEIKKPAVAPPPSNLPIGKPINPLPVVATKPTPPTPPTPPIPPANLVPLPPPKPSAPPPSIFVKKIEIPPPPKFIPSPLPPPINKIEPIKSSDVDAATVQAELEKALGGQIRRGTASPDIPSPQQNKKTDPYRESFN